MADFDCERQIEWLQVKNRLQEIYAHVYSQRQPLTGLEICVTGRGKGPERIPRSGWKPFAVGERWGGLDNTTWFRMRADIPKNMRGRCVVVLIRPALHTFLEGLDTLTEAGDSLAYVNGVPYQGIDRNHERIVLTSSAKGGERFDIALECCPSTRLNTIHTFGFADLAVFHPDVWEFYWDATALLEAVEAQDWNNSAVRHMFHDVQEAVRQVDLQHVGTEAFYRSLRNAKAYLQRVRKHGEPSVGMGTLVLVGHSHIDTAWLWPLRETQRKVARTFSTMLRLMEQYPEFHFSASTPQHYAYLKEHYPELYEQVRRRVKEGRWETCGAPWVEQDSNMPNGESLVRQFLYGNRFWEREFGVRSRIAWLPDAFGYPWSLPQIMRKCGIEAFITTKIDWGLFSRFPYSLFQWQGLDGTRILAVMPPLNYNGNPIPKDLIEQWQRFKQKEYVSELVFPFGWGDGGGGPTPEMIERGRRFVNVYGVPRCRFGRVDESIARVQRECRNQRLPVYNGELYLELHRACQTTQARTKRNHRRLEIALHHAECLSTLALRYGAAYPKETLDDIWQTALTHQFHDILPGSSIGEVYADADRYYAQALEKACAVTTEAATFLADRIHTQGIGTPILVLNTLSWARSGIVTIRVPEPKKDWVVLTPDGKQAPVQRHGEGDLSFWAEAVPPLGWAVYRLCSSETLKEAPAAAAEVPRILQVSDSGMENEFVRVEWDRAGRLTRLYDKINERNVLPEGAVGNVLQLFDDRPHMHDAWDIDHNFEDERQWMPTPTARPVVKEKGPLWARVRFALQTERSRIQQDIVLYADRCRVDIELDVDWHEKRALMKTAFPVDIHTHRATFEIAFGTIERPTHRNTAADRGRFEVPAHRWADLSEGDYGVSLLNDCKYGYDVRDNVMRLSLLRAPISPDPHADEGRHGMRYALFPHAGDWRCGTVQEAYEFNVPLLALPTTSHEGTLPPCGCFAAVDAENVILETVKKHEDSDAVILRLYEAYGQRGTVHLTFADAPTYAAECDLMEENDKRLRQRGNTLTFYIKPYEIRTFKVRWTK